MSGKMSNAAQSVAERRLRPIYDFLDYGLNKKALAEASKVLKKQPNFDCCKALMSVALVRMGREDEANVVLEQVLANSPTEDATLQAMSIAFRELQQPEKICQMYESASKNDSGNEGLLSHLFMAYVRVSDFMKQHHAAMQLFKVRPKNPYYFWAVMSLVLQSVKADEDAEKERKSIAAENAGEQDSGKKAPPSVSAIMLPLAERMLEKFHKDKNMESEQEMQLYIMVLELQKKYEASLNLLNGPMGDYLALNSSFLHFVHLKKVDYLKSLQKWPELMLMCKEVLIDKLPDQWNLYQEYLTSLFHIVLDLDPPSLEAVNSECDKSIEKGLEFIRKMQTDYPKNRGPFLCEIDLVSRGLENKMEDFNQETLRDLFVAYFERFGDKPCCFSDLKVFLPNLTDQKWQVTFREKVLDKVELSPKGVPISCANIYRHSCYFQFGQFFAAHRTLPKPERIELVKTLFRLWSECSSLVSSIPSTDNRPSDLYMVLAAHLLWDLWQEKDEKSGNFSKENEEFFKMAVVHLQAALNQSPASYHIKFVLIKFFVQAGAVGAAHTVYRDLDLKHMQLDSLGHLLPRQALTSGHFPLAADVFENTLKFFTGNYKDTVDHIISAYRCGSFGKVREFIALRDRFSSSQHYTALTIERMLLDLLTSTNSHETALRMMSYLEIYPEKDEVNWLDLRDNRDFKAMVNWESPQRSLSEAEVEADFKADQQCLRFRSLTIRALAAAFFLSDQKSGGGAKNPATRPEKSITNGQSPGEAVAAASPPDLPSTIKDLVSQLESNLRKASSQTHATPNYIQGPYKSRLFSDFSQESVELLILLLKLVTSTQEVVAGGAEASADEVMLRIGQNFEKMAGKCCSNVGGETEATIRVAGLGEKFEALYNLAESSNFICMLCGVCRSIVRPTNKAVGSKKVKKKKDTNPALTKYIESFNTMVSSVETNIDTLLKSAEELETAVVPNYKSGSEKDDQKKADQPDSQLVEELSSLVTKLKLAWTEEKEGEKEGDDSALSVGRQVASALQASYFTSFSELKNVLKMKKCYLSDLRSE